MFAMITFDSITYSISDNASEVPRDTLIKVTPMYLYDGYFTIGHEFIRNGKLPDLKGLKPQEKPIFQCYFSPSEKEPGVLVVRDVKEGIVAKEQDFASRTLRNVIDGFERAGHTIKEVLFDAIFQNIDGLTLGNSPLLQALVKVEYGKIRVVEIQYTPRYYQLIGERSDTTSCEYELLKKKN